MSPAELRRITVAGLEVARANLASWVNTPRSADQVRGVQHWAKEVVQCEAQLAALPPEPAPTLFTTMCTVFETWRVSQSGLEDGDAMELLMGSMTPAQRAWLSAYVHLWETSERCIPNFYGQLASTPTPNKD